MILSMHICPHLDPLAGEILRQGVPIGDGEVSPYGPDWGLWHFASCTFNEPPLRSRLAIPDFVEYTEYDGRVAGSDATFYCKQCRRAVMGMHPRYAPKGTKRVE